MPSWCRLAQARRAPSPPLPALPGPGDHYCYYRLGDREASEDATSVVFIKALGHLTHSRAGRFLPHLALRIAHNEIVDRHRHRARHPELPIDEELGLRDPTSSPEEAAIAMDTRVRLRHVLTQLPPRNARCWSYARRN